MTEQQPDDGLNFDKPFTQMTPDELADARRQIRAKLRELQRPGREAKLRRGVAKPKNRAEWEIFAADLLKDKQDDTGGGESSV
ncbi:MAG TPA: hypothetical protein VHO07_25315 [Streptosporangiaceae bacterium]|nr:hypothetical protein [Streptosporangiaceae bacterium]